MTDIYIVRHAEAEGNLYRRIHGRYDTGVTPRGLGQIGALERRFETIPIDAVFSSELYRARVTAEAISKPKGLPLLITPAITEVAMGEWEDACWGDVERDFAEQFHNYNTDPSLWHVKGSEDYIHMCDRMENAVKAIGARFDGKSVAIVTHGSAKRAFLCRVFGYQTKDVGKIRYCDNTAVSHFIYQDGKLTVDYFNDNSHLPDELSAFRKEDWWKKNSFTDGRNLRFVPFDLPNESQLYLDCYRDSWIAAHGSDEGFSSVYLSMAQERWEKDHFTVQKALLGDKMAGVLALCPDDDRGNLGGVSLCYMLPEFRDRGYGVQLIGCAVSYYRERGRDGLRLRVARENAKARRFYERYGFKYAEPENEGLLVMELDTRVPHYTGEFYGEL